MVDIAVTKSGKRMTAVRNFHTFILLAILTVGVLMAGRWIAPSLFTSPSIGTLEKYLGFSWPFFAAVLTFNLYVLAAWVIEIMEFAAPRNWNGIDQALHWATEACPLVGLLTTFASLLTALLAYSEAGPGSPGTQAAFISQFAIAFGSSIAGGLLALVSFTLHRVTPEHYVDEEGIDH